jgi:hypothetical protein
MVTSLTIDDNLSQIQPAKNNAAGIVLYLPPQIAKDIFFHSSVGENCDEHDGPANLIIPLFWFLTIKNRGTNLPYQPRNLWRVDTG